VAHDDFKKNNQSLKTVYQYFQSDFVVLPQCNVKHVHLLSLKGKLELSSHLNLMQYGHFFQPVS